MLTVDLKLWTVHYMVSYQQHLDRSFAARGDPTRRTMIQQFEREGGASVGELEVPLVIKLPAIVGQLDMLEDAGLVVCPKFGRIVTAQLRTQPMHDAMEWLERYVHFWPLCLVWLAAKAEARAAKLEAKRR